MLSQSFLFFDEGITRIKDINVLPKSHLDFTTIDRFFDTASTTIGLTEFEKANQSELVNLQLIDKYPKKFPSFGKLTK